MTFWNSLTGIGVQFADTPTEKRSVYLSNAISIVLAAAGLCLSIVYYWWYGPSVITWAIPVISLLTLSTLIFNHWNLSAVSRIWVCLFIPVTTMALSVYSKTIYYDRQEELDYFTFRILVLSSCVFPPVFFSLRERTSLILSSLFILLILMMHDPIHNFFGVPYRAEQLKESNYAFTNVVVLMAFLLMTGAVIFMKWISEANERRAEALIGELNQTNQRLHGTNREIEIRNEEISKQADHIQVSQRKLTDAYKIIEEQRNLLFQQNKNLSSELIEKNSELTETNTELIKHNNELRQFSYTVSHNLRGPVASLMGLMKIFDPGQLSDSNQEIYKHIEASTQRLDNIIKDLGKIIDIRHDIFQIRQQINLEHEINEILDVLSREIEAHNISVDINLGGSGILYSVRPMVHSILYNLISNAIKYRAPERKSIIKISSTEEEKFYQLEVTDNGLGIDLQRDKDNLFRLYKRFHHHVEGKGLGLYLVKLQAEALGGSISVQSEVNRSTTFIVRLRKPENAERQLLYQEPFAEIFFDAKLNCIGNIWLQKVTTDEYQVVTRRILDFIRAYNTPNFLSDLTAPGTFQNYNTENVFAKIIPDAARQGLSRIAVIVPQGFKEEHPDGKQRMAQFGITLEFFNTLAGAIEWIEQQNKNTKLKVVLNE